MCPTCVFINILIPRTSSFSTTILEAEGQEAVVNHVFAHMKSTARFVKNPSMKKKSLSSVQIASSKQKYNSFVEKFDKMSIGEKAQAAIKMVRADRRVENEGCPCVDEVDDDHPSREGGVMYASGIPVEPGDDFRISSHYQMIFMGVTTMNRLLTVHYHGVTRPMLYYGTTHSFAPAHVEDLSQFSVNFLHHGHPKLWIVVPPHAVNRLRNCIMDAKTINGHSTCPNGPLGHKYFIPTPEWMEEQKIPYNVIIQRPKQAVLLYPNAAHWVVNLGMNCAEASNYVPCHAASRKKKVSCLNGISA
ncbi:Lysine-specific demethylase 4 [Frankliniella fusca]|uniref:Lysine-specific demethylase 4 n=1 Tax=Frankliniella fusca TaxID=407009 RepID=A0AAE1HD66_9NEOP|nr:Lysine-specific demethylase 4 [Frankliniella fusca]